MAALLSVDHLTVRYGSVPVVQDLSFEVEEGETIALVGPNGAGKTSTLSAIMGLLGRQEGEIHFAGEPLHGLRPDAIARKGVALVPEGRHIFADLTVNENLRLGMMGRRNAAGADQDLERVIDLFPIVGEFLERQAGVLSGGQQQQLAIARALVADPKLLLLDEPSLGLAPSIIDTVFESLDQIRRDGRTIVIVEQRATRTIAFADRAHVLAKGAIQMTIDGDAPNDDAIAEAYFGI